MLGCLRCGQLCCVLRPRNKRLNTTGPHLHNLTLAISYSQGLSYPLSGRWINTSHPHD